MAFRRSGVRTSYPPPNPGRHRLSGGFFVPKQPPPPKHALPSPWHAAPVACSPPFPDFQIHSPTVSNILIILFILSKMAHLNVESRTMPSAWQVVTIECCLPLPLPPSPFSCIFLHRRTGASFVVFPFPQPQASSPLSYSFHSCSCTPFAFLVRHSA